MTNFKKFFTEITKEQWYNETAEIGWAFDVIRETHIAEYREQIRKDCEKEIEIINSSVLPLNAVENITKAIEKIHVENPMFINLMFEWIAWKENTLKLMMKGIRFENKKIIKLPWSSPTGNSTENYIIWYYQGKYQARIDFLYSNDDDFYWAYIKTYLREYRRPALAMDRWFKCDDLRGFLKLIEWYAEEIKKNM